MNLRELLEQRAERGTQIGSTTLMNRIEADLNHRLLNFANPVVGFAAAAVVTLVIVGGALLALRPDTEPVPPADTSSTTTILESTTTTVPDTTTSEAVDAALANRQFVWNYDPATGDIEALRVALESYDGSPYDLIRLVDEGDQATRNLVFDYLKKPSAWNVQTLALMQQYGAPGGTRDNPEPWPGDVKWAIFSALQEAVGPTFAENGELIVDLQVATTEQELDLCEETGNCPAGGVWYAIPSVVSAVDGLNSGASFTGSMTITSDTGTEDVYDIVALRTDEGWVLQEGYRTTTPFVAFMGPDSIVITTADLQLYGYADPLASLSIDGRPVATDREGGYWIADVWESAPEPGNHEITITATRDGETNTDSVTVRYEPDAVAQFAFIKGVDSSGVEPALLVDYAELLTGEEAVQAAIEDGNLSADQATEGLPNDYYLRNNNPQIRTLPLAGDALIYLFDYTITSEFDYDPVSIENLVHAAQTGDESMYYFPLSDYPVWLVVKDEVILQVTPQYLP